MLATLCLVLGLWVPAGHPQGHTGRVGSGWGGVGGPLAARWAEAGRSSAPLPSNSQEEAQQPGAEGGICLLSTDFLVSVPSSSWAQVTGIWRFPDVFGFLGKSHD